VETREALTIRFPRDLLAVARRVRGEQESLNELVVEAVDREVRRRSALWAFAEIQRVREGIKNAVGVQSDSGRLIRALREGDERSA
jgi:hypothetical protein